MNQAQFVMTGIVNVWNNASKICWQVVWSRIKPTSSMISTMK